MFWGGRVGYETLLNTNMALVMDNFARFLHMAVNYAKVRRGSFEPEDLFYAHIAGMDAFAKGLRVANRLLGTKELESKITERYKSYGTGIGKDIVDGKVGFKELEQYALGLGEIRNVSGRQEVLESILNQYLLEE